MKLPLPLYLAAIGILQGCMTIPADPATPDTEVKNESSRWLKLSADVNREMIDKKLPGLSIAVFDDYKLVHSQQWGVKNSSAIAPLDAQTAFSTASISKPVTALICVILEERGLLGLDEPIAQSLRNWQLPENEFTRNRPITWRDLLSHRAGTTQHGFADFYEGDKIPTLVESLRGEIPRYDGPIEIRSRPGTKWQYSGGGYVIVQLALEDRFGIPLHQLAQEYIFTPLHMNNTTMVQPGHVEFPVNAAMVHDNNAEVIRTGLPITPQIAASGMWSTPQDLAKFSLGLQRALADRPGSPISNRAARELTDVISLEDVGGMGMSLFRGFGFGGVDWLQHDGSNTGVGAEMLASMEGGRGIIMMANGDKPNRHPLFALLRREIITAMDWRGSKYARAHTYPPAELTQAIVGTYSGLLYDLDLPYEIAEDNGELTVISPFFEQFLGTDRSPMHYIGNDRFVVEDYPNIITFERNATGQLENVILSRKGSEVPPFARAAANLAAKAETE